MSVKFVAISGGVFVSYWILGLLQERLFKGKFGPTGDQFTYVLSLLFISQIVNCLYAYATMRIRRIKAEPCVPLTYQLSIATSYSWAMISSQLALRWVSYPSQVLAKSAKPIPVLLFGVVLGKKSYHIARYVTVLFIVTGVCLFMYRDDRSSQKDVVLGAGEFLLLTSLVMDGVCNSLQERVISRYPVKSDQFMFSINRASLVILGTLVSITGEFRQFLSFASKHPIVILQIGLVCLFSSIGQFLIYKLFCGFGTLTCSIVTTTRKFFTVLSSIVVFGHVLRGRQWWGIVFVFGGLLLDIHYGKKKKKVSRE